MDNSELERGKLAEQATTLNDMVQQLQGATEKARSEGKSEMEKEMKKEMENEKKKAFDEGYSRGYDKAGDELVDQVEAAEALFKQQQHSESYVLGYYRALDDAGVAADDAKRTAIEVPPLANSENATDYREELADAEIDANIAVEQVAEDQTAEVEATTPPVEVIISPEA